MLSVCFVLLLLALSSQAASAPVVVASGAYQFGTAYNSERKVVADGAGNLYATYSAQSANGSYFVRVSKSSDGGATWSTLAGFPAVANSSRCSLAIDRSGGLNVVWTEGAPASAQVYASAYRDGAWSPKVLLSNSKYYSGYPSIAADINGNLHVVWYGFDGTYYQIYYTRWNGSAWSSPYDLSKLKEDSLNPAIVADGKGGLHVVWYAEVSRHWQLWSIEFQGSWGIPVPITDASADSVNPSIAIGPQGQVDVVWARQVGYVDQIFHMSEANGRWGARSQLANGTFPSENPTQTFARNGSLYIYWTEAGVVYGCQLAGSCTPRSVYAQGYNSYPSAEWMLSGESEGVALIWYHQASAQNASGTSVLFVRLGGGSSSVGQVLYEAGALVVTILVVAVILLSRKGASHAITRSHSYIWIGPSKCYEN